MTVFLIYAAVEAGTHLEDRAGCKTCATELQAETIKVRESSLVKVLRAYIGTHDLLTPSYATHFQYQTHPICFA